MADNAEESNLQAAEREAEMERIAWESERRRMTRELANAVYALLMELLLNVPLTTVMTVHNADGQVISERVRTINMKAVRPMMALMRCYRELSIAASIDVIALQEAKLARQRVRQRRQTAKDSVRTIGTFTCGDRMWDDNDTPEHPSSVFAVDTEPTCDSLAANLPNSAAG